MYKDLPYKFIIQGDCMKNRVFLCTVAPNSHRTAEENLGISYLASVLRENGFVVGIIDAWLHPITDDEITNP